MSHSHRRRLKLKRSRPSLFREIISRETKRGLPFVLWYITLDNGRVRRDDRRNASLIIVLSASSSRYSSLTSVHSTHNAPTFQRSFETGCSSLIFSSTRWHPTKKKCVLSDEIMDESISWLAAEMDAASAHCKSSKNKPIGASNTLDMTSTKRHSRY